MGILTPETKKLRQLLSVGKGYWNYDPETKTLTGFFQSNGLAMAAASSLDWYDVNEAPIKELASNLHYVSKANVSADYVAELKDSMQGAGFKVFSIANERDLKEAQKQANKQLPEIAERANGKWQKIVTEAENDAHETSKISKACLHSSQQMRIAGNNL